MFDAVGSPGHGLQPFLFDRLAVNQTSAVCPGLDSVERVANQVECRRVGLGAGELPVLELVGDTGVTDVARRVVDRFAGTGHRAPEPCRQRLLPCEQILLVLFQIQHATSVKG